MEKTIGFIGAGNMGYAIGGGIISSGLVAKENIIFLMLQMKDLQKFTKN